MELKKKNEEVLAQIKMALKFSEDLLIDDDEDEEDSDSSSEDSDDSDY
jgi:hypothetical protein